MFAPWKLTWISSEPATSLVLDWWSTLVPAAPFSRAGSAGDTGATAALEGGTPASGLTAAGVVVAAGVLVAAGSAAAFPFGLGSVSCARAGVTSRHANSR